jgi:hypothetical protein
MGDTPEQIRHAEASLTWAINVPSVPVVAQTATDGTPREAPHAHTASVVRAELARRRISGRALGSRLAWSERTTRRRLGGVTPFTVTELAAISEYLEVPFEDLIPPLP